MFGLRTQIIFFFSCRSNQLLFERTLCLYRNALALQKATCGYGSRLMTAFVISRSDLRGALQNLPRVCGLECYMLWPKGPYEQQFPWPSVFQGAESQTEMIKRRRRLSPLDQFKPENPDREKNPHSFPKFRRKMTRLYSESPSERLMTDRPTAVWEKSTGNNSLLFLVMLWCKNANQFIYKSDFFFLITEALANSCGL